MMEDKIEFFDAVNEKDEVIRKIADDKQNTVKSSQLRFVNIIIINDDNKILLPKISLLYFGFPKNI